MKKNYAYVDVATRSGVITVWCRDEHGQLFTVEHDEADYTYCYQPSSERDMLNLHNQPMKKASFPSRREMQDFVGNRKDIAMSDVSSVDKLMIDEYNDIMADAPYNILYYDIEVAFDLADGKGYPTPENPHGEINLFQAFDKTKQRYTIITYDKDVVIEDKEDGYPVDVIRVAGEASLLDEVAILLEDIDIFTGWYTSGFDLPYIMARALMLFDRKKALSMFCRDGFHAKSRTFFNDNGKEVTTWNTVGRVHVDMLDLFKKFNPGERTSFSLNAICEEVLGLEKVEFDGDLGSLARDNPQVFHDYGLRDAFLLMRLDKKMDIVPLAVMIARLSSVRVNEVTGSIRVIDNGLIKFAKDLGIVLPDKRDNSSEKFPGAIVYDTIAGLHGWVMTVDLSALYPSVMRMLGLSPETIVMHCLGGESDFIKITERQETMIKVHLEDSGEVFSCSANEMWEIIRESGYTISANGVIFNGKMGLIAQYVESLGANRKKYQKLMREDVDVAKRPTHDLFQKVFKVFGNSAYGCIGNSFFRLFDLRMAAAITTTAQHISKHQAMTTNRLLCEIDESLKTA